VSAGENVLAAALAAGIPLPHSCREGRCASCKARLLQGEFAYPGDRLPPGITAAEADRGELLLCQARPRGNLVIETRRGRASAGEFRRVELVAIDPLPLGALRVRARGADLDVRPGQFLDVRIPSGEEERAAVTALRGNEVELEVAADGGALHGWLERDATAGAPLAVRGPFDRPRQG
jgi:CDP-4-dehydro-6-deoxyglucose reductase